MLQLRQVNRLLVLVAPLMVLTASLSAGCVLPQARSEPPSAAPATVTLPGLPRQAHEPQAAIDKAGNVYITFGAGDTLYASTSHDGGKTYGVPVRVATAGKLSLGMRRGPRIAIAGKSVVVSAVYGQAGGGQDGDLLAWRSENGGKTWTGPATVNDIPGAAREGLHAMAADSNGKLACAWLDLRGKGTQIYGSLSADGGKTWSKNTSVYRSPDGTVCECCHPSVAFTPNGALLVMWRNWLGGSRDMYLARSANGGKSFGLAQKLGSGTWPLNACPMDGGALAVTASGTITTVWRRDGEMFACSPGASETKLGPGEQGWATATDTGTYTIWLAKRSGRLWCLMPGDTNPRALAESASDPVVASRPSGRDPVIAAWEEGDTLKSAVLMPDGR